jgi:uncharacterized protein YcsI (UPF0317 family)
MKPGDLPTSPQAARLAARAGELRGNTAGVAYGFVQGNVAILPRDWAYEFERFCQRNPKPCPVQAAGVPFCITHYPGSMLVTDLRNAELAVL